MRRLIRPLMYIGTFAMVLTLGRIHAQFIGHYIFHASDRLPWTIAYAFFLSLAAYAVGLPDLAGERKSTFAAAVGSALAAALGISLVQLGAGSILLPRFVVGMSVAAVVPWYVVCSVLSTVGRSRDAGRDRVVAVVEPEEATALRADLEVAPERPARLVAALSAAQASGLGPLTKPLVEAAIRCRASVVVLDRAGQADESVVAQAATLHENGVRVRTLSLFYDEWLGKLPLGELERVALMFDIGELHRVRYVRVKRLVDVAFGLVGTVCLLIALPFVLIGNLVGNRGPIFYRQLRVGRQHQTYEVLKFRSMTPGSGAAEWTREGDRRVTPFGRLMRKTHLDELPQALNILRGDQSLVGPRPEQPKYVAELREKIPFYELRHLVRPGLTGWAQVKYDYGSTELDALEKLQYEFYYLRHQGLALDARIVGRTIRSVARLGGR